MAPVNPQLPQIFSCHTGKLYERYGDDFFFIIIHADHIHLSLEELNNQYSQNIHLTYETEVNSCIQLLDVMITKEPDSAVSTA